MLIYTDLEWIGLTTWTHDVNLALKLQQSRLTVSTKTKELKKQASAPNEAWV